MLAQARARGWRALALNFRGCSGDMNRLVRSYHSGETGDLDELVRRARDEADRIVIAGCSLGGNVLVKWLGEQGASAPREIKAASALCVPFDLKLSAQTGLGERARPILLGDMAQHALGVAALHLLDGSVELGLELVDH